MDNVYEQIRERQDTNKFVYDDLLFAGFGCSVTQNSIELMSPSDHLIYVVSGKKSWHSQYGSITGEAGEVVFLKKGARSVKQFFDAKFCFMVFFFSDDFIREVLIELGHNLPNSPVITTPLKTEIKLSVDTLLSSFFRSMAEYFVAPQKPSELLLRLKFKEFITNIIVGSHNNELKQYFQSLASIKVPYMNHIMEGNYLKKLTIGEYAQLCHHSVSSFKRDFHNEYKTSPGKWIVNKRLDLSAYLIESGNKSVSAIAIECGFVDLSHFSNAFKNKFGVAPSQYKKAKVV